jgi:hypothetical protein
MITVGQNQGRFVSGTFSGSGAGLLDEKGAAAGAGEDEAGAGAGSSLSMASSTVSSAALLM